MKKMSVRIWNSFCLYGSVAFESSGTKKWKKTVVPTIKGDWARELKVQMTWQKA